MRRGLLVGAGLVTALAACGGEGGAQATSGRCRAIPDAPEPSACAWKVEGTKAWVFVSGLKPGTQVRIGTRDGYMEGVVSDDGTVGGGKLPDGIRVEPAIDSHQPVSTYTVRGTARSGDEVVLPLDQ